MHSTQNSANTANIAFLFPGQGAQAVGMGQDFYQASDKARRIYDTFDRVVTDRLSRICFEGPEEDLRRTLYTQPAILATAIAALALFRERGDLMPRVAAGHSLGEYGALYAAGVVDLETVAALVKKRAELMENAPKGAMSAVLGLPEPNIQKTLHLLNPPYSGQVVIANYNTGDQYVISGTPEAVAQAAEVLKEEGAKRVLPLNVGGAFHSPLMDAAAGEFKAFLEGFTFQDAGFPVITNMDALPTHQAGTLREKLADQINHPVCWAQTMSLMFTGQGVDTVIEFGPGKVLTGMIRKIYKDVAVYNVFDLASLEETCEALCFNKPGRSVQPV